MESLIAELKDKASDVEDWMDAEYNSGLAFNYKCIMSVLKKEYPELNMDKLEAGVNEYMAEQSQCDKGREETPSGVEEQEKDVGDKGPNTDVEAVPAPFGIPNPSSAKAIDSSTAEVVKPPSQYP